MNTDMNQYFIFMKCMGKAAQALKIFLRNSALGFVFRSSVLSTALILSGYECNM